MAIIVGILGKAVVEFEASACTCLVGDIDAGKVEGTDADVLRSVSFGCRASEQLG